MTQSLQHFQNSLLHLSRGLVGKGHSQNLLKARPWILQSQLEVFQRKRVGLARACGGFVDDEGFLVHVSKSNRSKIGKQNLFPTAKKSL